MSENLEYISSKFNPEYQPGLNEYVERTTKANLDYQWKERNWHQDRYNRDRLNEYLRKRAKYELNALRGKHEK